MRRGRLDSFFITLVDAVKDVCYREKKTDDGSDKDVEAKKLVFRSSKDDCRGFLRRAEGWECHL